MHVVYDIERGPIAARALEIITASHCFSQDLADFMAVSNPDTLPPASLMAEWAVRCVYTDHVAQGNANDNVCVEWDNEVHAFLEHSLGLQSRTSTQRFLYAVNVYITQGRRVQPGLWPDVEVMYAPCNHDNACMQLALRRTVDDDDNNSGVQGRQAHGKMLLSQARFVLPTKRNTINFTGSSTPNTT